MRLRSAVLLGALGGFGARAFNLFARQGGDVQNSNSTPSIPDPSSTPSAPSSPASSTPTPPSSSVPPTSAADKTITITKTVTNAKEVTVTKATTVFATVTSTIVITDTDFSTKTVTSSNEATSTKTIFVTTTSIVSKRAVEFIPDPTVPPTVEAVTTADAFAYLSAIDKVKSPNEGDFNDLRKRATVTVTDTVTVGGSSTTTVFNTVSSKVVSDKTVHTTVTSTITSTFEANAKTTTTVTSTLTVTSTSLGPSETTAGSSGSSGSSSSSSGLSTGAKAGIGVGAALGGLLLIGAIVFFCMRSRRNGPKPEHDDMIGASEVPVGLGASASSPRSNLASSAGGSAAFAAPGRSPTNNLSPEGYRGTAMGDGRAGYAKPEPYGAAYRGADYGTDALPEHAHPTELDNTQQNGYEMAARNF